MSQRVTRMRAYPGDACRVPRFSDFPVLKSVFSIDGGAIGVGI
jgi:hypothetical protein